MKKTVIPVLMILLLGSCISLNQFMVTPVGEEPEGGLERFIYALPRTCIEVNIEYCRTTYIPGPYKKFAEKYLGITETINAEKNTWEITGADFREYKEPDPSRYYSVNLVRGEFTDADYFKLSSEGIIIDPMGMISGPKEFKGSGEQIISPILELTMKKSLYEKTDTFYKTVITDSTLVKIPILRKQKEAKTLEQKAEEAANLVIKIRKRRLKLVSGEYDVFPEGKALEIALEELNKTEREYVELFTGRTYKEYFSRSFTIVPGGGEEKVELARFSATRGLVSRDSREGEIISLGVVPDGSFLSEYREPGAGRKNTLYYRLPAVCEITLSEGEKVFFTSRIPVFQSGHILPLPLMKGKL